MKRELEYMVGGNINWCSHDEKSMKVPKKNLKELPYDPEITLVGIQQKKMKTLN